MAKTRTTPSGPQGGAPEAKEVANSPDFAGLIKVRRVGSKAIDHVTSEGLADLNKRHPGQYIVVSKTSEPKTPKRPASVRPGGEASGNDDDTANAGGDGEQA